jgi:hypothetical protein
VDSRESRNRWRNGGTLPPIEGWIAWGEGREESAWKLQIKTPHTGINLKPGGTIRTLIVSLMGVVALTAGVLAFLSQRHGNARAQIHAGEKVGQMASLERLRELGL